MASVSSHILSSKLKRILDTGLATVEEIADAAGSSYRTIREVARGSRLKLDLEERERISRSLSKYFRNSPDLYRDPAPVIKRGVFAVELRARDWRAFEVRNADGKCIMYVEWPANLATQERIDRLWRWLEKEDAQQLKVI